MRAIIVSIAAAIAVFVLAIVIALVPPAACQAAQVERLYPCGVAIGPDGSVYVADWYNHRIRKIDPAGIVTTVAGNGQMGYSGDGGPAGEASLWFPHGVAVGEDGSVYIADTTNHRVRKVDSAGVISTVAGNGAEGYAGDGGLATAASLCRPHGVAVSADGTVYIADHDNHRVRKVDPAGIITTVAGNGTAGYSGDGGPAIQASLHRPSGVAVRADGSLYIADRYNHRIRRVDPTGIITTVAGNGKSGDSGDGGPATAASMTFPHGLAVAADGTVYIAATFNHRIRKVDPAGVITTAAGNGKAGNSGDGGPATAASLGWPFGVAVGADGSVYIADHDNHRVRKVDPAGIITTIAASASGGEPGDGSSAGDASAE